VTKNSADRRTHRVDNAKRAIWYPGHVA
jgi:hypothetical protein